MAAKKKEAAALKAVSKRDEKYGVRRVEFNSPALRMRTVVTLADATSVQAGDIVRVAANADEKAREVTKDTKPAVMVPAPANRDHLLAPVPQVDVLGPWEAVDQCIELSRFEDKDALAAFCERMMNEVGL